MAMGVPVVTTTIGAENIYAKDGKEWIVADDNKAFADAIIRVLRDEGNNQQMIENAFEFVKEHFTWSVAENRMKECLPLER